MLAVSVDTIRVFLHVLAATVWVGGQLVLAALTPALRRAHRPALTVAAQRFNVVAWPAFAVLVGTGIWNILAVGDGTGAYRTTLTVKLVLVGVSGLTAFLHLRARTTVGLAVYGALTGASSLGALFVGVLLVRGS